MGEVGGGVQDGDTCTPVADSCQSVSSAAQSCPTLCEPVDCSMPSMYGKNHHNIVKQLASN